MKTPRVWAEIDLDQVARNVAWVRSQIPSACKLLAVVKADAYGHGAEAIARILSSSGVDMLGVGNADEGIALRHQGIESPILVLGGVIGAEIRDLISHRVTATIHSSERISQLEEEARRANTRLGVHLLVDTGMARLGVAPENVEKHALAILRSPGLYLQGVGTHLASPANAEAARRQLATFEQALGRLERRGMSPPLLHQLSSRGLQRYPEHTLDMVRIGGLIYGLADQPSLETNSPQPVLSLKTQVIYIRDLPPGSPVGYGGSFVTSRNTRLATLPVGYHDGYSPAFSNRAEVLIKGKRAAVRGQVTMDYLSIDITDIPEVKVGDTATLLGSDGEDQIHASELASLSGSPLYEFPSLLGRRVMRRYSGAEHFLDLPQMENAALEKLHP